MDIHSMLTDLIARLDPREPPAVVVLEDAMIANRSLQEPARSMSPDQSRRVRIEQIIDIDEVDHSVVDRQQAMPIQHGQDHVIQASVDQTTSGQASIDHAAVDPEHDERPAPRVLSEHVDRTKLMEADMATDRFDATQDSTAVPGEPSTQSVPHSGNFPHSAFGVSARPAKLSIDTSIQNGCIVTETATPSSPIKSCVDPRKRPLSSSAGGSQEQQVKKTCDESRRPARETTTPDCEPPAQRPPAQKEQQQHQVNGHHEASKVTTPTERTPAKRPTEPRLSPLADRLGAPSRGGVKGECEELDMRRTATGRSRRNSLRSENSLPAQNDIRPRERLEDVRAERRASVAPRSRSRDRDRQRDRDRNRDRDRDRARGRDRDRVEHHSFVSALKYISNGLVQGEPGDETGSLLPELKINLV